MLAYIILNLAVMATIGLLVVRRPAAMSIKFLMLNCGALLILTAIFDTLIIAAGIVDYDVSKISGLYIGRAPVEDFAYSIVAAIIVPYIWIKVKHEN